MCWSSAEPCCMHKSRTLTPPHHGMCVTDDNGKKHEHAIKRTITVNPSLRSMDQLGPAEPADVAGPHSCTAACNIAAAPHTLAVYRHSSLLLVVARYALYRTVVGCTLRRFIMHAARLPCSRPFTRSPTNTSALPSHSAGAQHAHFHIHSRCAIRRLYPAFVRMHNTAFGELLWMYI